MEEQKSKSAAEMSVADLINEQIDALRKAVRESPDALVLMHGPGVAKQVVELACIRGAAESQRGG